MGSANISVDKTKIEFKITPNNGQEDLSSQELATFLNENIATTMYYDGESVATGKIIADSADDIDVELTFSDGSTATMDAYFGTDFKEFINSITDEDEE